MDSKGRRDVLERLKISCPYRNSTPDHPALTLLHKPTVVQDVFDEADNMKKFPYRRYFLDTINKTRGLWKLCLE
jgi:hypothetical protein